MKWSQRKITYESVCEAHPTENKTAGPLSLRAKKTTLKSGHVVFTITAQIQIIRTSDLLLSDH